VLVATTRQRSTTQSDEFTSERARKLGFERYTISVPKSHKPGEIEYPGVHPDPSSSFVVTDAHTLDLAGFRRAIAGKKRGDVLVFLHGYNTTYPESVFGYAQLIHDASVPSGQPNHVDVLFAWPSRGELTAYLTDRESATFSRNYLEEVLNEIATTPGVRNIDIVAHSMGNWLALETLRQARLRARSAFVGKLRGVTLVAPDIDADVFLTQLDTIGKLRSPITVVVNKHDLALAASQFLSGEIARVGNVLLDDKRARAAIEKYNLRVVDLSDVKSGDPLGHSTFVAALPALEKVIQSRAVSGSSDSLVSHVLVANAAGQALTAPIRIGQTLVPR
jgi:esterase/lipase superfamily enzyme